MTVNKVISILTDHWTEGFLATLCGEMTPEGRRLCSRLESIIEKGQQTFVEVGNALMEIRDSGLYKMFGTFERYCMERRGFTSRRARQLVDASKINENLKSGTIVPPRVESQTRPLTQLPPDQQREAWREAVNTVPEGKVPEALRDRSMVRESGDGDRDEGRGGQKEDPLEVDPPCDTRQPVSYTLLQLLWKLFRNW